MIPFNPEMLILAREARGLTQTQVAAAVGAQQGTISKTEAGLALPADQTLEKLSDALGFPVDFFYQQDRVFGFNSAVFFHRKRQALPDRVLRKIHAFMNITRMRIERLLRSSEVSTGNTFQRIELADYDGSAEEVGMLMRAVWTLPHGPVRNLTEIIESAGGIVVRMNFGTRQADAVSEWVPGYPPIFLVNGDAGIPGDRLRLTLAHEVAHVLLHRYPNPDMEDEANEFAAEFLMPRREIKASLYNLTLLKLVQLKRIWKVSMAALVHRAFELGTITDSQRRYLYINMAKRGYRTREPIEADVPLEIPTILSKMVRTHIEKLDYTEGQVMGLLYMRDPSELKSVYLGQNLLGLVG
jgi:Zn-dependent peptidase ImmA (M78 family)/transcriptional regulator with XRE-family HTH domain